MIIETSYIVSRDIEGALYPHSVYPSQQEADAAVNMLRDKMVGLVWAIDKVEVKRDA